jgi:hypothetical protein
MSNGPRRTAPFPGWARGIPIVGQRAPEPPPGRYFYEVSVLVKRAGRELDAESLEIQLGRPLEGVVYKALPKMIVESLKQRAPELPDPRVVIVNVWELGFVTQEALDRAGAQTSADGNGGVAPAGDAS